MAFFLVKNNFIVVVSGNEFRLFDTATTTIVARISCEEPPEYSTDAEKNKNEENGEVSSIPGQILSAVISQSGRFLAVADDHKRLRIWCLSKNPLFLIHDSAVARRITAIAFTPDENFVLVADKNGDSYSWPVLDVDLKASETVKAESPRRILGHLGMLLDIKTSNCGKYVITCDRDEKIRVSHFPNAYNVRTFHLAHSEFVYRLCVPKDSEKFFFSGGGDGKVILWSFESPKPLMVVNLGQAFPKFTETTLRVKCLEYLDSKLCVVLDESDAIIVYEAIFTPTPQLTLLQTLLIDNACVLDIKFLGKEKLAALRSTPPFFQSFLFDAEKRSFIAGDDEGGFQFIDSDFMEAAAKVSSLIGILEKSKIDNMKSYLETKEKRLTGNVVRWGKKKSGMGEKDENVDAKKIKL